MRNISFEIRSSGERSIKALFRHFGSDWFAFRTYRTRALDVDAAMPQESGAVQYRAKESFDL